MTEAIIYKPDKTATQSGKNKTKKWVLEFNRVSKVIPDNLMGWSSSSNTKNQVKLFFETEKDAINYAEQYGISFKIMKPQKRRLKLKSYSDNFAFDKYENWTH